jgi:hypothetical protein
VLSVVMFSSRSVCCVPSRFVLLLSCFRPATSYRFLPWVMPLGAGRSPRPGPRGLSSASSGARRPLGSVRGCATSTATNTKPILAFVPPSPVRLCRAGSLVLPLPRFLVLSLFLLCAVAVCALLRALVSRCSRAVSCSLVLACARVLARASRWVPAPVPPVAPALALALVPVPCALALARVVVARARTLILLYLPYTVPISRFHLSRMVLRRAAPVRRARVPVPRDVLAPRFACALGDCAVLCRVVLRFAASQRVAASPRAALPRALRALRLRRGGFLCCVTLVLSLWKTLFISPLYHFGCVFLCG